MLSMDKETDESNHLISVIIAAYNVEQYIEDAVVSVQRQTYKNLQIIIIDDGSSDNTLSIINDLSKNDDRIQVFTQKNRGLGETRNRGVALARGDYLIFLDGDDYVPVDAYNQMIQRFKMNPEIDFVVGRVTRVSDELEKQFPSVLQQKAILKSEVTNIFESPRYVYDSTAWNKMYKKKFFRFGEYHFPHGFYEDIPVSIAVYRDAKKFAAISNSVYFWRERGEKASMSITQSRYRPEIFHDRLEMLDLALSEVEGPSYDKVQRALKAKIIDIDVFIQIRDLPYNDKSLWKETLDVIEIFMTKNHLFNQIDTLPLGKQVMYRAFLNSNFDLVFLYKKNRSKKDKVVFYVLNFWRKPVFKSVFTFFLRRINEHLL